MVSDKQGKNIEETNFTENFPSLKGVIRSVGWDGDEIISEDVSVDDSFVIRLSDIQEHCLDKQKVRDAEHWLKELPDYALKGYRKELGL